MKEQAHPLEGIYYEQERKAINSGRVYAELDEKLIENEHGVLFIEIGRDENDEPHFWLVDHDILDALHKMCMNLNEELIQYADQIWE